ncbi:MAG: CbtB domain-containing protein [Arenicella sp.]
MTNPVLSTDQSGIKSGTKSGTTSTLGRNIAVMLFGIAILFVVGFMPIDAAHNAAHDTRHALAFPCH